jgi:hypothetical protein
VLGADVVVLERASFLLGEDDHLTGSLCESLEHLRNLPAGAALGRGVFPKNKNPRTHAANGLGSIA